MDCICPGATFITPISAFTCGVDLKQIQRLAFQRRGDSFDTAVALTDILDLADWQTKISASDDTKIVVTPKIGGDPIITAGDALETGGGGNDTLNGVTEINGKNPSTFTCVFKSLPSNIQAEIETLMCESANGLVVYLFLQGGSIAVVEIVAGVEHKGFDIEAFFFGDRNNEGFGTKDTNAMSFQFPAYWSSNLVKLKPNFNPLEDL